MIRNLKILIAAAMALVVFGAISVSGAQAAEGHCSVEPCKVTVLPDGTPGPVGKTGHHVFIIKTAKGSLSITCQQLTGNGTVATKTFKTFQLGSLAYHSCEFGGHPGLVIRPNGCEYHLETPGVVPHDAKVKVVCPAGKEIEIELAEMNCLFTIGSTGVLTGGVKFHDAETAGVKKELITAETTVSKVPVAIQKSCLIFTAGEAAEGEYTTGNVELTGGTAAAVMGTLWWE